MKDRWLLMCKRWCVYSLDDTSKTPVNSCVHASGFLCLSEYPSGAVNRVIVFDPEWILKSMLVRVILSTASTLNISPYGMTPKGRIHQFRLDIVVTIHNRLWNNQTIYLQDEQVGVLTLNGPQSEQPVSPASHMKFPQQFASSSLVHCPPLHESTVQEFPSWQSESWLQVWISGVKYGFTHSPRFET